MHRGAQPSAEGARTPSWSRRWGPARGCCAEDSVVPVWAEWRWQAQDPPPGGRRVRGPRWISAHRAWPPRAEPYTASKQHPPQPTAWALRAMQRCPNPRDSVPGSTRSLGHHLRQTLVPPKESKGKWMPICRAGRHRNNPTGATHSSTLPSVLATSAAARRVRAGPLAPAPLRAHRRAGQDCRGRARQAATRTCSGLSATVSLALFGGIHVQSPPGMMAAEEQTGRRDGAARQAHASDMCCSQPRQTAGSGSLNVWKQHFSVSHFTKPQTITVCRCTGA